MGAFTRISSKGQVVIPKAARERWRFAPGTEIEVVDTEDGILLKPRRKAERSFEEVTAELRRKVRYTGPRVSIEEMN